MRTYSPKPGEIERQWHVIDASDVVLGRLATHAATLLRGKHKPTFAPHVDTGDFVIVINAGKVALTGNKRQTKIAYRHSGYPGGLKQVGYEELLTKRPERAIELAVKGMLPHNKLGPSADQEAEGLRRSPSTRTPRSSRCRSRSSRSRSERGRRKQHDRHHRARARPTTAETPTVTAAATADGHHRAGPGPRHPRAAR